MKIAVASEGLDVSPHFGRCSNYSYYLVEKGIVTNHQNLPSPGHVCDSGATLMKDLGIDVVITGGIGEKALNALKADGISVVSGATGSARDAVEAYLAGELMSTATSC